MPKRITTYLLTCLSLSLLLCAQAQAVSVEQIQVSLPRVDVYVHADTEPLYELDVGEISASLDGQPLLVESFQPSEQGIFYTFMLDISKSIPKAHLEAAKQAVRDVCSELRPQDRLALLSFGNEVTVLSAGDEEISAVLQKLDALACTDDHTQFYTAMDGLIEMASKAADMRRIAVVMSDGIDDTDAGMSQETLENVLQQSGIAVYALCIDTASAANVEHFRQFIRLSGGELYPYGAQNADSVLQELLNRLNNVWMLQLLGQKTWKTPDAVPLEIEFGTLAKVSAQLEPDYWAPDETPPYVAGVQMDPAAHSITVSFSEPVSGGDQKESYRLLEQERLVEISDLAYVGEDHRTVRLIVPMLTSDKQYDFTVFDLTDISENQNALIAYHAPLGAPLEDTEAPAEALETAPQSAEESLQRELRNLILLSLAALAVVAGLIVLILRFHKGDRPVQTPNPRKKTSKPEKMGTLKKETHKQIHFVFSEDQTKKK